MKRNDLSRSLVAFDQASTMVSVVELGFRSWLVAGLVPGLKRQPLKKLGADAQALLTLLRRWQVEATKAGSTINRIVVAFEAGRGGFWLARWLRARGIEAYVIHPTSIPVSREHRRAKTDRLDTGSLMRLAPWRAEAPQYGGDPNYRGRRRTASKSRASDAGARANPCCEPDEVDADPIWHLQLQRQASQGGRPSRGTARPEQEPLPPNTVAELRRLMARLQLIREQIKAIEKARLEQLKQAPRNGTNPMVLMLAQITGIGVETADMLVHELLSRRLRDQRAVARYGGLTGAPDESGTKRREKGLARAGNACVRHVWSNWPGAGSRTRKTASSRNGIKRERRAAQNHDYRLGPQAADRTVALRDDRRGAGWRGTASGDMS